MKTREELEVYIADYQSEDAIRILLQVIKERDAWVAKREDDILWLSALEAAGVDNWSGYDIARGILRDWKEEAQ